MKALSFAILFAIAGSALADDYLWFERDWISDADVTYATNPAMQTLPDNVRDRFRNLFGKLRWNVSDGLLEVQWPDAPPSSDPYFVRAIDESSFELSTENGVVAVIRKRDTGFCVEGKMPFTGEPMPAQFPIECFKPFDH